VEEPAPSQLKEEATDSLCVGAVGAPATLKVLLLKPEEMPTPAWYWSAICETDHRHYKHFPSEKKKWQICLEATQDYEP
jgi:hypothetical protein